MFLQKFLFINKRNSYTLSAVKALQFNVKML